MNTFALILLAWPFYLAIKGKLVQFASLATGTEVTPPTTTARSGIIQGQPAAGQTSSGGG